MLCILRHITDQWKGEILMQAHQTCVPVVLYVEGWVYLIHMYVLLALLHYLVGGHGFHSPIFVCCKLDTHSGDIVCHLQYIHS